MKKSAFYILTFITSIVLSCNSDLKREDIDNQKTTELFMQILQSEEILKTNCILETSTWKLSKFVNDFKAYIQENLKIKDTSHLNLQIKLFNDFIVTKEMALGKNILKKEDYDSFNRTFETNDYEYLDWLEKHNCKEGFNSISKPLFNETYDLAIVHINKICGPLCGGSWTIIYEFENKQWTRKAMVDATVK